MKNLMQALNLFGARSRNRTGTSFRTGDFKSHASTNFAIRAVALCSESNRLGLLNLSPVACVTGGRIYRGLCDDASLRGHIFYRGA